MDSYGHPFAAGWVMNSQQPTDGLTRLSDGLDRWDGRRQVAQEVGARAVRWSEVGRCGVGRCTDSKWAFRNNRNELDHVHPCTRPGLGPCGSIPWTMNFNQGSVYMTSPS